MTVRCDFTISGAKTIIRALDHLVEMASTRSGSSGYTIDELCRRDCAARMRELRGYINSRLPKKYRVPG